MGARSPPSAAIAAIYAHHVLHGTATFELDPPDAAPLPSSSGDGQKKGRGGLVLGLVAGAAVVGLAGGGAYLLTQGGGGGGTGTGTTPTPVLSSGTVVIDF